MYRDVTHVPRASAITRITPLKRTFFEGALTTVISSGIGTSVAIGFLANHYRVAGPGELLLKTGFGIRDVKITDRAFVYPFQNYHILKMKPVKIQYPFDGRTADRKDFRMEGVIMVAPGFDSDSLTKVGCYIVQRSKRAVDRTLESGVLRHLIDVFIDQAERTVMEDIVKDQFTFEKRVIKAAQGKLDEIGLVITHSEFKRV